MVWGFLEVNTGVVCAALPALKPLFARYLPKFLSSRSSDCNRGRSGTLALPKSLERDPKPHGTRPQVHFAGDHGGKDSDEPASDDDEMHLWHSRGKGSVYRGKSVSEEIVMEPLHDKTHGSQTNVRTVVSVAPYSMALTRHSMTHSITVTTETKIETRSVHSED